MAKSAANIVLTVLVIGIALLVVGISGLWIFMTSTATVLHPNPREVPSMTSSSPSTRVEGQVEQARHVVRASLAEQNLPGLSVAVAAGSDIVWAEGFGFADLEKRVPVAPNHLFRIGIASKVLTSAAAGLLLEQGLLKLDDAIQTYVPEFPAKQWPVTLRQLMAHLGGVKNDSGDEGPLLSEHCERPVDALPHFADSRLLFQPGSQYRYSSYGWILVSAAVEKAANMPFLTFMRDKIFQPSGMRDTMADSATGAIPRRVSFYFPRFAEDPVLGLHPMRKLDYSCYAGSSVFLSTPSDMVRFGMSVNSGKLLKPATLQLLQTPQRLSSGEETGYGLGWDLETVTLAGKQTRVVGHNGATLGGMVTSLLIVPEHQIVVSVMSNISYADTFSLSTKLAEIFGRRAPGQNVQ